MSATATQTAPATYFDLLDRIEGLARQAIAGIPQQRLFLQQMIGGIQNGSPTPAVIAAPVEEDTKNVPDASKIVTASKKKNTTNKKPRKAASVPAIEMEGDSTPDKPSLRSVCWEILNRPAHLENGLKSGGENSVLQIILDEKSWVSKKNGNMAVMVSQCLHNLKKQGKVTRNAETYCFIAKPGITLD